MLSVNGLKISFGGISALKGVSFEAKAGEILGIIGPNGAGKTTLINCISRYYEPKEGEILFNGASLLKKNPDQLQSLGISRSFQDLDFSANLSVIETIMGGLNAKIKTNILRSFVDFSYLKEEDRKYRRIARDTMNFFADVRKEQEASQKSLHYPDINGRGGFPDLIDLQDVPFEMLPYAVRKRVDLARAIVSKPKLLLLDEPAGGLSIGDLDELLNIIRMIRDRFNTTILLIEHRMSLVMKLCDRIMVLNFGEKIAEGTPAEIKVNPTVISAYLGNKGAVTVEDPPMSSKIAKGTGEVILELKNIDVNYGHVKALSSVSLDVRDQSITCILGSNGAGKSTLLKAVSGIEKLSNGEIHYKGKRINHWLDKVHPDHIVRQGVVQVPEGRRIFKELTVMENLKLAGYILSSRKEVSANIEKVFSFFPVLKTKIDTRNAGDMSGGQQQMLAIGQALMMNPKLLLLDEPSLGLAPGLIEELFEIIQAINRIEKCPIVVVEQNAEIALRYADFAFVLEAGFLMKKGTPQEIRKDEQIKQIYLGLN